MLRKRISVRALRLLRGRAAGTANASTLLKALGEKRSAAEQSELDDLEARVSVSRLFIRPPPFRIAICSSLAPDLPGLQWTAGGSQLGATLKVIVSSGPNP